MSLSLNKTYLVVVLLFIVLAWQTDAQDSDQIVLSVQLQEGMAYLSNSTLFSDFEAAYPGVQVNVIYKPLDFESYNSHPIYTTIDEHLDKMDDYTVQADVLMMSVGEGFHQLTIEATRAGYVLDLMPLFNGSSTADGSVYYPTVWQAAQWDSGLWILPTSTTVFAAVYDAGVLDEAGLGYPNADWTAENFATAAEVLAERNPAGEIMTPGFMGSNGSESALVHHFLGHALYDNSQFPPTPNFLSPEALALADIWLPALSSGAMFNFRHEYAVEDGEFNPHQAPLKTDWVSIATLNDLEFAPLPGERSLVNINGFTVSSRTQYPQLAYELASYLANDVRVAEAMQLSWGGMTLARPEYDVVSPISRAPRLMDSSTEAARTIIDAALINGIPASEFLLYPYFKDAMWRAAEGEMDIETALRDAEILATDYFEVAAARRNEIAGSVPTPVPEITLPENAIELTFHHAEGDSILWQEFVDEFAENDPEVGRIVLQNRFSGFDFREEGTDCFYSYSNFSSAADNYDYVIDISPLLTADAEFVAEDWLTGVFDTVSDNENIYALPLDIRPLALWYEPAQLETQGLLPPQTISELLDALTAFNNEDMASLAAYQLDTTLLMLITAQGALPINYASDPIQLDFTSDENVATIQQILDLARDGYIKYDSITEFSSSSFPEDEPFITDFVSDSMFRDDDYVPILFPAGLQYTPLNYNLMAGYISRFSQYPEACYRLLKSLAQRPDLLAGIPVNLSEANRSEYDTFFEEFNQQLSTSNLVVMSRGNATMVNYWLSRAFDRYVLEDADLLSELESAEQITQEYLLCEESGGTSYDCALQVDPSIGSSD